MPKHRIALRCRIVLSEIAFFIVCLLYGSFYALLTKKKAAGPSGPAASECFGQPN
jgi:hypothetical protein